MKSIFTLMLFCFCSCFVMAQEKWGSYDGSIAGSHFVLVEACGDSVELSTGNWYEKVHITAFDYTMSTSGRKVVGDSVFFKYNLADNSAPFLLYDYSLGLGDTVYTNWGKLVVTEVDSEFAVGKDRKRITMESVFYGHKEIWLEGLGSKVAGYLNPGSPLIAPDAGSEFSCYLNEKLGEFYYGDTDPSLCMLSPTGSACVSTSVNDPEFVQNIKVFPNPADDFIEIFINNGSHNKNLVQLYSLDGKRVLTRNYDSDNLSLDVSQLTSGMYLLEISQNGNQSYHKIIIQ